MGINNEYAEDAYFDWTNPTGDSGDEDDADLVLEPEEWHDWHSEHLLNMWMSLRQYLEDNYMNNMLMNHATFHDFAEFVRHFSR